MYCDLRIESDGVVVACVSCVVVEEACVAGDVFADVAVVVNSDMIVRESVILDCDVVAEYADGDSDVVTNDTDVDTDVLAKDADVCESAVIVNDTDVDSGVTTSDIVVVVLDCKLGVVAVLTNATWTKVETFKNDNIYKTRKWKTCPISKSNLY
ncbi:hypothetical protein DPMN_055603 [Dreissena polymorpha]|uniref:Uncharacterized protein n=1 Tax=Dreissena polymorpha TaxID=45954 RepID=A0A9D4HU85_DREPO|nr:hypothetical protein DPMN_055603 [Dreissena polymorpha]